MAIYQLRITSISRGAGRSATAAAAYRAGERIRDERTGSLHNYAHRQDVLHKEIFLPSRLGAAAPDWARDRAQLWNTVERLEKRRNSRLAREYQVALPAELSAPERLELAQRFARELSERHGVAVDLAVHAPRPDGDPRNHHAHLLATSREVLQQGLGAKAGLDMGGPERRRLGLLAGIAEMKAIRERWASLSNEALASAGLDMRVEHRSHRARGIDREPKPAIPLFAIHMERRGQRSQIAARLHERYRERVLARAARATARERASGEVASVPTPEGAETVVERLRREAREQWLKMRQDPARERETDRERGPELPDRDLAL